MHLLRIGCATLAIAAVGTLAPVAAGHAPHRDSVGVTAVRAAGPFVATIRTCSLPDRGNAEVRVRDRRTGRVVRRTTTDGRPLCRARAGDRTRASHLTLGRGGAVLWAQTRCHPDDPTRCEPEVLWRWTGAVPRMIDAGDGELGPIRPYGRNRLRYTRGTTGRIFAVPRARRGGMSCRSGRTIARAGGLRVFKVGGAVLGCLRPRTGVVPLGVTYAGGGSGGSASVGDVSVARPYVAYTQRLVDPAGAGEELRVVDLRTGRTVKRFSPDGRVGASYAGSVADVHVTGDGGVVWSADAAVPSCRPDLGCRRTVLWAWVDDAPRLLDIDDGPLSDVRLDGATVTWTRGGDPRSATLTRACDVAALDGCR